MLADSVARANLCPARCNASQRYAPAGGQDRIRGQLGAVVADDQAGQLAEGTYAVALARDTPAGQ